MSPSKANIVITKPDYIDSPDDFMFLLVSVPLKRQRHGQITGADVGYC